jgi:hypothetical protein
MLELYHFSMIESAAICAVTNASQNVYFAAMRRSTAF